MYQEFYPLRHRSRITCWTKSFIPASLRPYAGGYQFSSGGVAGPDFLSFDRKYKNAIKKLLPQGWSIYRWNRNHYQSSAVLQTDKGHFVYLSYPDVRFWTDEWMTGILIRRMEHEKDWTPSMSRCPNEYTDLVNFTEDLLRLESRREPIPCE